MSTRGTKAQGERAAGLLQPPWNGMTLPGLLSGAATLRADAPALVDQEDVEALAHRAPRRLTSLQLREAVNHFARQMLSLGLEPGETVILHLPNTVEATIALLGVQAAGGIPATVPVFEDGDALRACVELTGAVAIVTIGRFAGLHLAEKCRDAAAYSLSVRFLCGPGADLPAGVVSLDAWDENEFDPTVSLPRLHGEAPALITFDACNGVRRALVRSHEQIIAEAASAAAMARVNAGHRLLLTIPPSTAAGVVYGVALPLLSGAMAELHALFDSCAFASQLGDGAATILVLPGSSETAFAAFCAERSVRSESLVLVHRPEFEDGSAALAAPEGDARIVDVTCLGESFLHVAVRQAGTRHGALAQRKSHPVPGVLRNDAPQHVLSVGDNGALAVSGPLAPVRIGDIAGAALMTGYRADMAEGGMIILGGLDVRMTNAA